MPITAGATTLSTILSNLGTGGLLALGNHLTASNEARALAIVDSMSSNPATAGSMVAELTQIPGLPETVLTWVNEAVAAAATPALFTEYMVQAKAALAQAMVNPGILGNLLNL